MIDGTKNKVSSVKLYEWMLEAIVAEKTKRRVGRKEPTYADLMAELWNRAGGFDGVNNQPSSPKLTGAKIPLDVEMIPCPIKCRQAVEKLLRVLTADEPRAAEPLLNNLDAFVLLVDVLKGARGLGSEKDNPLPVEDFDIEGVLEAARSDETKFRQIMERLASRAAGVTELGEETREGRTDLAKRKRGDRGRAAGRGRD